MGRLTITLSEGRHRALKEAAARRGRTIGELIEESLERAGIRPDFEVRDLVARARDAPRLSAADAMSLATQATREVRRG